MNGQHERQAEQASEQLGEPHAEHNGKSPPTVELTKTQLAPPPSTSTSYRFTATCTQGNGWLLQVGSVRLHLPDGSFYYNMTHAGNDGENISFWQYTHTVPSPGVFPTGTWKATAIFTCTDGSKNGTVDVP